MFADIRVPKTIPEAIETMRCIVEIATKQCGPHFPPEVLIAIGLRWEVFELSEMAAVAAEQLISIGADAAQTLTGTIGNALRELTSCDNDQVVPIVTMCLDEAQKIERTTRDASLRGDALDPRLVGVNL